MERDLKIGRYIWVGMLGLIIIAGGYFMLRKSDTIVINNGGNEVASATVTPTPLPSIPPTKTLFTDYHTFQTFNNCAPAGLSIALSFYNINISQQALAASLRPYNNLRGDNDDKSTPPPELGAEAEKYGLISYFRSDGDTALLKQFIANDIPVLIRALFKPDEDYAHYRVIKGYDERTGEFIQDDSYDGKNLRFSYKEWDHMWQPFNYSYLILVKPEKKAIAEKILGDELDPKVAWKHAEATARRELNSNPNDIEAQFNLSVALYYQGDNEGAIREYEKVEHRLGQHVIWYQIEPIQAYFNVGKYDRVFALAESILSNNNRAFTELYILRGKIYQKQGKLAQAKTEFENAVMYNRNSKEAKEALNSLKSN